MVHAPVIVMGKGIKMSRFFILNDFDRPYPRHIVEKQRDGNLYYMDESLSRDEDYKHGFVEGNATDLEDFGFAIAEDEKEIRFQLCNESVAKYRGGEPRQWQGEKTFAIKKQ